MKISNINGLNVLRIPNRSSKIVNIRFEIKQGAINELSPDQYGISHMLEHMYFKRTKYMNAKEISYAASSLGGIFNAFTSRIQTCLHMTILKDKFESALNLIHQCLRYIDIDEQELELEKGAILSEVDSGYDDPWSVIFDKALVSYLGDQFGHTIGGDKESIKGIMKPNLIHYNNNIYKNVNNLLLIVAGDISSGRLKKAVNNLEHFSFEQYVDCSLYPEMNYNNDNIVLFRPNLKQAYYVILTPTFQFSEENASGLLSLSLLSRILGSGSSSLLFQRIREEKGLCYHISAGHDYNHYYSHFNILTSTSAENFLKIETEIDQVLKDTFNASIQASLFEMYRQKFLSQLAMSIETSTGLAGINGQTALFGISNYSDRLYNFFSKKITYANISNAIDFLSLRLNSFKKKIALVGDLKLAKQLENKWKAKVIDISKEDNND